MFSFGHCPIYLSPPSPSFGQLVHLFRPSKINIHSVSFNSGKGLPPPHSGNARKKTFFLKEVFPNMPYTCVIDLWLWMTLRDTSKLIKRYYSPKILRYVVACSLNSVQFRGNDTVQSAHGALHWQIRPIFPEKVLMFPQKCVFSCLSSYLLSFGKHRLLTPDMVYYFLFQQRPRKHPFKKRETNLFSKNIIFT